MDDVFNPYYTFLGLDEELESPNFYQLLRLREGESDPTKINAAADKAATRVRGHRPGENVAAWSRLLDEIQAARTGLLNPDQNAPAGRPENPAPLAAPAMSFVPPSQPTFAYPPGGGPQPTPASAYAPTPYYPNPAAPAHPQPGYSYTSAMPMLAWSPAQPAADPMAPMTMPAAPGPMSPVGYSWSTTPPAGPALAPPIAPVNPNTFDPMAPVAFPVHTEPPAQAEPAPRIVGFAGGITFASSSDPQAAVSMASPVGQVVAVPVGEAAGVRSVAGLPSQPASARPPARRPAKLPLALTLGIGGGVFLLVVLIIAWSMSDPGDEHIADNTKPAPVEPAIPSPRPEPEARPQPVRPKPAVKPEPEQSDPELMIPPPKPKPKPKPERPSPVPEPIKPEPSKPEPKPEPVKPEPVPVKPTSSELAELSRLMKEARTALGDFTFDEAELALAQAEKLAKLPEHKAIVLRLKAVADMAKKFRRGIEQTMAKLEAGEVIKVGTSTEAAIVEASPDKLIIRVAGQNKTYTLNDMPLGLAVNLGERAFSADDPNTRLLKGSYVFIDKRTDPTQLKKAKTWWEEAQLNGVDIREILPVLTDKYDFTADAAPE